MLKLRRCARRKHTAVKGIMCSSKWWNAAPDFPEIPRGSVFPIAKCWYVLYCTSPDALSSAPSGETSTFTPLGTFGGFFSVSDTSVCVGAQSTHPQHPEQTGMRCHPCATPARLQLESGSTWSWPPVTSCDQLWQLLYVWSAAAAEMCWNCQINSQDREMSGARLTARFLKMKDKLVLAE